MANDELNMSNVNAASHTHIIVPQTSWLATQSLPLTHDATPQNSA